MLTMTRRPAHFPAVVAPTSDGRARDRFDEQSSEGKEGQSHPITQQQRESLRKDAASTNATGVAPVEKATEDEPPLDDMQTPASHWHDR